MTLHNMLGDLALDETVADDRDATDWLSQIITACAALASLRDTNATLRVGVISGTLPAVTTVSTVTNQTQAGGYSLAGQVMADTNCSAVAGNIANVIVS